MGIKLGNTDIDKIYLGSVEINKAYLGDVLVYEPWIGPNTFIGGIGAVANTPALLATALGGIAESDITDFSVDGSNNVACKINKKLVLSNNRFYAPGFYDNIITYWFDLQGKIEGVGTNFMRVQTNLKAIYFPRLKSADNFFCYNTPILYRYLPKLQRVTLGNYKPIFSGQRLYAPLAELGISSGDNNTFLLVDSNLQLYTNILNETNNGGSQDGDIDKLVLNGGEAHFIANTTPPANITDLSVSVITSTTVILNFTPPTSTNSLSFYEVWLSDGTDDPIQLYTPFKEIYASGQILIGLVLGTSYTIKIAACDEFYNGSGLSETPAYSNEITFSTLIVGEIADLNVTAFDDTSITLDWTTPSADNPIDYYEVWLDGVFLENTTDATEGWVITGLTASTSYDITLKTVDDVGNKSGFSNEVTQATTGAFDFATDMIGYWKLATNSNDSSGNGNNGIDTAMTYSAGYAQFGDTRNIRIPNAAGLNLDNGASDYSAMFLISFIWDDKSGNQFFISKRGGSLKQYQIVKIGSNLLFYIATSLTNYLVLTIPDSLFTAGTLHTILFKYDGSKVHTGLSAILDGNTSVGTTSMTGTYTGMSTDTNDVYFGSLYNNALPLKAKGKEWAMWRDRPLFTGAEAIEIDYRVRNGIPLI
jgi:hypothetical protein